MLNSVNRIKGTAIRSLDGEIGSVSEAYFEDRKWVVRYLVVDTGTWLAERKVLISPYSIKHPLGPGEHIDVRLTQHQVRNSPDLSTHLPVSRQHEREFMSYYAYPDYWAGADLWAMGGFPYMPLDVPQSAVAADKREVPEEDRHLRSSDNVEGYDIQASDGSIGHVKDFIFDDESWALRYFLVDTRNWWPGGKKVLIATHWISDIDWNAGRVSVALTRQQIKDSPEYNESTAIDRVYEQKLHDAYGRRGYWDE